MSLNIEKRKTGLPDEGHCTGCAACVNVCPRNALRMAANREGFLQPYVEPELCTNCGLCERACPLCSDQSTIRPAQIEPKKPYCGLLKDESLWRESSSGGAFSGICQVYADGQAVIFGARFEGASRVVHDKVYGASNAEGFRGSKYVQSEVGLAYRDVKAELDAGHHVLFSGTPCQIAGLRCFLRKNYERLLCVEFICHGVGSPYVFSDCIKHIERIHKKSILRYAFRTKLHWPRSAAYSAAYYFADGSVVEKGGDVYNRLFLRRLIHRKSCGRNCVYRTQRRFADVTIADSRCEKELNPEISDSKNRSVIVANTQKGADVVEKLSLCMELLPYTMDMLRETNPHYFMPNDDCPRRQEFFDRYLSNEDMASLARAFVPVERRTFGQFVVRVMLKIAKVARRVLRYGVGKIV